MTHVTSICSSTALCVGGCAFLFHCMVVAVRYVYRRRRKEMVCKVGKDKHYELVFIH